MYSEAYSAVIQGIEGRIIHAEADVSDGLPCFSLVGCLSSEVKEAKERVRIALKNSGFKIPPKKITINLSPANIRKDGTCYDFAIAAAILSALGIISEDILKKAVLIGELSLDGKLKAVSGVLPMVYTAYENGIDLCIVPKDNVREAMFVKKIAVIGIDNLREAVDILNSEESKLKKYVLSAESKSLDCKEGTQQRQVPDFADIGGQLAACRGAEVAVSGMHNFLMIDHQGQARQ